MKLINPETVVSVRKLKTDQKAILCDSCETWIHISCNKTSISEYEHLVHKSDLWHCRACNIKNNIDICYYKNPHKRANLGITCVM